MTLPPDDPRDASAPAPGGADEWPTEPTAGTPGGRGPSRPGRVRWSLLLVLASLAVLVAGLVDLAVSAHGPAGSPAASQTAPGSSAPTGAPGSAPATPGTASPSPRDVATQIAEVESQVPALRDLQPTRTVPNRIIDEAELRRDMARLFDQENPAGEIAGQQALLERMGLLPPGYDLRSRYLDALGTGVAGYYDYRTRAMTIVQRSTAFGPVERLILAHEYTHALQDMHFGLPSVEGTDTTQGDRSLARTALIEGDASLAMSQYAQRYLTVTDLLAVAAAASDPAQTQMLDGLPPLLRRQLEFPYVEGLGFVSALYEQGGWAAVDAAYAKPPDSTAQILHPALYLSGVQPVGVTLPDVPAALGGGWKQSATDTVGEMAAGVWLSDVAGSATATSIASGWAGDRVASYDGPNGAWAVAWVTAWTSDTTASSFAAAAGASAGSTRRVLPVPGARRVAVLFASDGTTLTKLEGAIGR